MSDFKGSPGPWVTVQNGFTQCGVRDARGYWLTYRAGDHPYLSNEEVEANARVMAASLELLEALQLALHELEAYCFDESGEHYNNLQINAAIAKATGAEPC